MLVYLFVCLLYVVSLFVIVVFDCCLVVCLLVVLTIGCRANYISFTLCCMLVVNLCIFVESRGLR